MMCSFLCSWALIHRRSPGQLVHRRHRPVGLQRGHQGHPWPAPVGGAVLYRMLRSPASTRPRPAPPAAATSLVSTATSALPVVAVFLAPVRGAHPRGLLLVAWAAASLLLLFGIGFVLVTTDQPLLVVGGWGAHRALARTPAPLGPRTPAPRVRRAARLHHHGPRLALEAVAGRLGGQLTFDYLASSPPLRPSARAPACRRCCFAYGAAGRCSAWCRSPRRLLGFRRRRPGGLPHPRGRPRGRRPAGHARIPPVLLLAPAARRPSSATWPSAGAFGPLARSRSNRTLPRPLAPSAP